MEAGTGLMSPHSWRKLGVAPCKQCKKPVGVSGEFGFCSVHCRLKMLADKRAARDQRIRAQEYLEATAKEAQRKARLAANQARERQTMMAVEKAQRIAEAIGVVCKVCKEGFNGTYDKSGWVPQPWAPEVCHYCTGLLRFYGAKGSHQPRAEEDTLWRNVKSMMVLTRGGASTAPHDVMLEVKPEEFTSSNLDAPFDTALRAFVKIERKISAKKDTARKMNGIGAEEVASCRGSRDYRMPDTDPDGSDQRSPWDSLPASLQAEADALLDLLKLGAVGNHAPSQTLLGLVQLHGHGAPRFEAHGLSLLQRAVDADNAVAQYHMGRLCLLGHGAMTRDRGRAARLFGRSADRGFTEAQRILGHMYHSGVGVVENLVTAARYWEMAATSGDADSQFCLGMMYSTGKGKERNDHKSMELWLAAALGGSAEAEFHLGSMHERGVHGFNQDNARSFELYEAAAAKGHGMAQYHAGVMCLEGRGGRNVPDDAKAVEYFELAAENDVARAQFNLGILILEGRGGGGSSERDARKQEASDKRAKELFQEAARGGLAEAQCSLAWMYVNGRGSDTYTSMTLPEKEKARARDEAKALKLYKEAAEQGIAEALFHLGLMYFRGVGVPKDEPVGMEYVMQAAYKGHREAQYELGLMRILLGRNGANRETAKRRPVPNKMGDYDGDDDGYDDHTRRPPPPPPPPGSPRGGRGSPTDNLDEISPDMVLDEDAAEDAAEAEKEWTGGEPETKQEVSDEESEDESDEDENAQTIEDWLNNIQQGYGEKYNGIFRSLGYETEQKIKRGADNNDAIEELLSKLERANAKRPQLRRIKEAIEKLTESSEEESEGTSLSGSLGTRSKLSKGGSSKGGSKGGSSKGGSKSGYSRDKYSTSKSSKKGEKGSKSKSSVSSSDTPTKPSYDRRKYEKKKAAGGKSVSSSDTPTKSGYDPSKYQKKGQQTKTMTL